MTLSGDEIDTSSPFPLSDMFKKQCPYYMSFGMSYDDFWNGDAEMVVYYREANKIKRKNENEMLWLQGRYIYEAIGNLSPLLNALSNKHEAVPYMSEPLPITKEDLLERQYRQAVEQADRTKQYMLERMHAVNKKGRE